MVMGLRTRPIEPAEHEALSVSDQLKKRSRRFVPMVELSGIEPLTSSLRIQGAVIDSETPDDTE
jgi:hypothetical protein